MKKVTLSVAALTIAMSSFGQCVTSEGDSILVSNEAINALSVHKNLYLIVNDAEDMLKMIEQDVDSGFMYKQYAGFYQEVLANIIKLASTTEINGEGIDNQTKY